MREVLLLLAQILFVLVFLFGVAMVYLPAALMLAGIIGVLAFERASVGKAADK